MMICVVGATSAVAQAAIRDWAARGDELVLFGRNAAELERIAADARVRGAVGVAVHAGEITSIAFIEAAVATLPITQQALVAHGSLTDAARGMEDLRYLAEQFNVNFISGCAWTQCLANKMATQGSGSIAVISSVAGERGRYSNFAYGSAKAGLTAFCDGLRARMLARGVHVITVKPGSIDTPMTASMKKGLLFASAESVAKGIVRALDQQRDVVYLPRYWQLIMTIVRAIPERVAKRLKW